MQACAAHPTRPAVGNCRRCRTPICSVCRTRWQEQGLCPACVEHALANPQGTRQSAGVQRRLAIWSLLLGLAAWLLLLGAGLPLVFASNLSKEAAILAGLGLLLSLLPALFAVGQGVAVVRERGSALGVATAGVVLAASQLGLMLGVVLLSIWAS